MTEASVTIKSLLRLTAMHIAGRYVLILSNIRKYVEKRCRRPMSRVRGVIWLTTI